MAGIYIHIPFCKTRCIYCDFYSTTYGGLHERYIDAISKEIVLRKTELSRVDTATPVDTIYIGGGTPSTIATEQIRKLLEIIYKEYAVSDKAEVTLEANPDDMTETYIRSLRALPVNRLSMGVQSFDDEKLRFLRRRHSGKEAIDTVKRCQDLGFDNISIDLIYGLPSQSLPEWEKDIDTAICLHTQHLSAYALIYEEGTALWKAREAGSIHEVTEETSNNMFTALMERTAAAGFEHYEISNFARPGFRSRHNSSYWKDIPYIGVGTAAHSYNGYRRQWNCSDIKRYIQGMSECNSFEEFNQMEWIEKEILSLEERYNDRIITALRTSDGLSLDKLQKEFGKRFVDHCMHNAKRHLEQGLLEHLQHTESPCLGQLRITRRGIFVSDGIMSDLLVVND